MGDSVRITIEADDKTAAGIVSAITNIGKLEAAATKAGGAKGSGGGGGKGIAGLGGAVSTLNGALGAIGLPTLGFAAVLGGVVAVTKNAIQTSAKYNEQVRDLSLVTGTGAEKTSRMLQVLDDFQIGAEDVTVATKALTKNGLAPTVETLAQLSDEYLKLNTAQEQNEFILKNLGKGGLQWVNLLKQGKDSILSLNDGVNENLILTDEQIAAYEKYRLRMDNVSDSVQGLKVSAGNWFFDTTEGLGSQLDKQDEIKKKMESIGPWNKANFGRGGMDEATRDWSIAFEQAEITGMAFQKMTGPINSATLSYIQMAKAVQTGSATFEGATVDYNALLKGSQALTKAGEGYKAAEDQINQSMSNGEFLRERYKAQQAELKQELKDGTITQREYEAAVVSMYKSWADGTFKTKEQAKAMQELNAATDMQTAAYALNALQQDEALDPKKAYDFAAASGLITKEAASQFKAIDKVNAAYKDGKISAEQAAQAIRMVSGDVSALNGMTSEAFVDVYIRVHGSIPEMTTAGLHEQTTSPTGGDRGSPLMGGRAKGDKDLQRGFIGEVGEQGTEGLIFGNDGKVKIIPNNAWKLMKEWGVTPDAGFAAGTAGGHAGSRFGAGIRQTVPRTRISGSTFSSSSSETSTPAPEIQQMQTSISTMQDAITQLINATTSGAPSTVNMSRNTIIQFGKAVGAEVAKAVG